MLEPRTYSLNAQYFIDVITKSVIIKDSTSIHDYCQALKGLREIAVVADCLTVSHQTIEGLDSKHSKIIDKIQDGMEQN